ncbi:MAG: sulfurtransferase TusA family protein [Gallionella sp.]
MDFDTELDVKGLECPMPILRAKQQLSKLVSGQVLKVIATDKAAPIDFAVFCDKTGNELLSSTEQNGEFFFLIQRR